jgi:hypothetical protein
MCLFTLLSCFFVSASVFKEIDTIMRIYKKEERAAIMRHEPVLEGWGILHMTI